MGNLVNASEVACWWTTGSELAAARACSSLSLAFTATDFTATDCRAADFTAADF
jgi:hypothetical protein